MSCRAIETNGAATLYVTPLGEGQVYVTAAIDSACDAAQAAADAYAKVADLLAAEGMEIVQERIFGSLAANEPIRQARAAALKARQIADETPVTCVQGHPLWGEGLAGVSLLAVRPAEPDGVWLIRDVDGRPRGRGWKRHHATFLCLQGLHGKQDRPDTDNSRAAQAGRLFDLAGELLQTQKTDYRHVTRTWIYLSKILDWYDEFNEVRNAKYDGFGLMPRLDQPNTNHIRLPASTGIEGDSPGQPAATMDVLATILAPESPIQIHQMTNVKQRDAFQYGSAFSRGAAIRLPDATWISLSGTAAIDEKGVTLHVGDVRKQIHMTLDNIASLIAQEGAKLTDLCDATIFLKHAKDAEALREVLAERGLEQIAGVCVVADVCRDDLLFEIDGAAAVSRS